MLSANENPVNLPGELVGKIADRVRGFPLNRYPDPMASDLRGLIAEANGLDPGNVLVGNGGDELIFDLLLAWGGPGRTLLDMPPTFVMYGIDARGHGDDARARAASRGLLGRRAGGVGAARRGRHRHSRRRQSEQPDGQPDAGDAAHRHTQRHGCARAGRRGVLRVPRHTMRPHMGRHPNLVILRTFSKAFSLAGMRVGYLLAHEEVIHELTKVRQPYSVDRFSQMVAAVAYRERAAFESGIREIIRQRGDRARACRPCPG